MRFLLGLFLVLALSAGALALPWPFAWIYGLWALYFVVCAVRARSRAVKLLALCCGAPALFCCAAEITLLRNPNFLTGARFEGTYSHSPALWSPDEELGYAPAAGLTVEARRIVGDDVLYDVHYSYDAHRLRVSPPVESDPPAGAILCFGGSFTLGEGLDDERTYPYRVGELSGRRYEVRNFGFHGYGPHHSLAMLQKGRVDAVISSPPSLALYWAIPDHAPRVAGRKDWDKRGPWYEVEGGALVRRGRFDERAGPALLGREWLARLLRRSALVSRVKPEPYQLLGSDLRLWEAVVVALRDEVAARYPDARFYVLAWENPVGQGQEDPWPDALARLQARGIDVRRVREMLPDLPAGARLPTFPHDPHPTAEVQEAVARYVVERLLSRG